MGQGRVGKQGPTVPPVISFGIVNYNSGYRLRQCLDSVAAHPPSSPYEVIVVDNASSDDSIGFLLAQPRPHVRLVANRVNLLTIAAVNQALECARGPIFMILNPDMVVAAGAFDNLLRHFDEDPSIGGIGGYTLDPKGTFEAYVRRFPSPFEVFLANYLPARAKRNRLFRRFDYGVHGVDFSKPFEVDVAVGGCLAFRRSIFEEEPIGEEFGIFWGDSEIAKRIWNSHHKIMVFPDARFRHDHKPRTIEDAPSMNLVLDYLVGCEAYFRKFGKPGDAYRIKLLFGAATLLSLLLKHLPMALIGRERWAMWRARSRVLRDFRRGRNTLLIEARATASALARTGPRFAAP